MAVAKVLQDNGKNVLPYTRETLIYDADNKLLRDSYITIFDELSVVLTLPASTGWTGSASEGYTCKFSIASSVLGSTTLITSSMSYRTPEPYSKTSANATANKNFNNFIKDGYWLELGTNTITWHLPPNATIPSTGAVALVSLYKLTI